MATPTMLQPPSAFDFSKPREWGKWKNCFHQYRMASGLSEKSGEQQVSTLLYCMGEAGSEDVLNTTDISREDKKNNERVISKFTDRVRNNIILERACFNQRSQEVGESAELYITTIHQMAERCEYGTMKKELIQDRLVAGIQDKVLSQRLQMETDLTLAKAKTMIRQREAVKEQGEILKGTFDESSQLSAVRDQRAFPGRSKDKCRWCGKESHRGVPRGMLTA